ncbi:MAG: hypothetical protein ACI85I_002705, partial [Arenicella sp.]
PCQMASYQPVCSCNQILHLFVVFVWIWLISANYTKQSFSTQKINFEGVF